MGRRAIDGGEGLDEGVDVPALEQLRRDALYDYLWWADPSSDAVARLGSDTEAGLSTDEAERRLERVGSNELVSEPVRRPVLIFLAQFANTMIVVLLIAAGVTVAIGDMKDAMVIGAIVVLNAVIGFVQEYRAERAMAALRTLTSPSARVVRDGIEGMIPSAGLVPGDVVVLEAGDVVPADARIVECPNLRVNEAPLTGESVPVDKLSGLIGDEAGELIGDRRNMVFKGTSVVYGRARAVVVATGMSTAIGHIAGLMTAHQAPRTPLQRRLAVLGRRLAAAALVVCVIVFTAGVLRGEDVTLMFLTAVSLAVAAIPEALPAVVTISLALGAQRMVHHHALIRKLPAVETLGLVTVICTDKTGTLTQGRMLVERVWTLDGEVEVTGSGFEPTGRLISAGAPVDVERGSALGRALAAAVLCNDATLVAPAEAEGDWGVVGDPTEGALLAVAAKAGIERDELQYTHRRVAEVPFDSNRKRMTTLHHGPDSQGLVATKGAIEAVLESAHRIAGSDGEQVLDNALRQQVLDRADRYAADGYRVLGLAGRPIADGDLDSHGERRKRSGAVRAGGDGRPAPPRVGGGGSCLPDGRHHPGNDHR